jgi:hypothetical protein
MLELEIPLTDERFLLRVVDREGDPIADVRVLVTDPRAPGFVLFAGTDGNGECELRGVPDHDFLVGLQHGTHGIRVDVPIDAGDGAAEIELEGRARIELALRDGETPLAGAGVTLLDQAGNPVQAGYSADDLGHASIGRLGEGLYHLRATRADCWTTDFQAEAGLDEGRKAIEMRRLGDLEFELSSPGDQPVTGQSLRLTSLEFEVEVAEWIRTERVRSKGLTSNALGLIEVQRLPRGSYRWILEGLESGPMEGAIEVQPGKTVRVPIRVPR